MQRALMWLDLYGCEAVQRKLKNSLKTQKMHFLPVFELTSDSLTTRFCAVHCSVGCLIKGFHFSLQSTRKRLISMSLTQTHEKFLRNCEEQTRLSIISDNDE